MQAPEPVGNQCLTSYVHTKADLKCHLKYHDIYLSYQMAICLTKMPLLPLRYLSYKCWFSLIKIPDCRPRVNQISSYLLAAIWLVKLCQQSHLSNCLFRPEYAVSSAQREWALCRPPAHCLLFALQNAPLLERNVYAARNNSHRSHRCKEEASQ